MMIWLHDAHQWQSNWSILSMIQQSMCHLEKPLCWKTWTASGKCHRRKCWLIWKYDEIRSFLFLWFLWWLLLNFRFAQNKNNQSWAPQPDRPATWRHQGGIPGWEAMSWDQAPITTQIWKSFGNRWEPLAPHLPPSHWWRIRPSAARIDLQKHIELIYRWHPVTATFIDATLCEDLLHMVIKFNKAVSEIANHRIAAWNDL